MLAWTLAVLSVMDTSPTPHNLCTQPWANYAHEERCGILYADSWKKKCHDNCPSFTLSCSSYFWLLQAFGTAQRFNYTAGPKQLKDWNSSQHLACFVPGCRVTVVPVDPFQPHRVLQFQSHGFYIKVIYQNKKSNNNNLKIDWHENCSTFDISSHNRAGTSTAWIKLRHIYQYFSNEECRTNSCYLKILMFSSGSYMFSC